MEQEHATILANCAKNLERGRAPATGSGIFVLVEKDGKFLFVLRDEEGSMFNTNLSGKWELPGGGVELADFSSPQGPGSVYQWPVISAIKRELEEEAGLELHWYDDPVTMIPAWLMKNGQIDLAFVVIISMSRSNSLTGDFPLDVYPKDRFHELIEKGKLRFFSFDEIQQLNIISPRMRYMAETAIFTM